MLSVLADRTKLAPFVTLKRKDLPKEKLPIGIIFNCIKKYWMISEFKFEWLREVGSEDRWNSKEK
jgi:hypothetical protein